MNRKEHRSLSLYNRIDTRKAYFAAGLGYLFGSAIGGVKGVLFSLRETEGKPNGMAYFIRREAESIGHACALGSISAVICRMALEKGGWAMLGR